MVISSPTDTTEIPTGVYCPFYTFVLSENVFCQCMVFLLKTICALLFGLFHVFNSDSCGFDRLKIVEFGLGIMWEAWRKETFHTITDFTLSHVLIRNSKYQCDHFLKVCSEILRISEEDVFLKQSADKCYVVIISTLLHRMLVTLLISKPSKTCASLTILLSYNSLKNKEMSTVLFSAAKYAGSGRAQKKYKGETRDVVEWFPPLRECSKCFTTEQSTTEASLFVLS